MNYEELFRDRWKWQALHPSEPSENWPRIHDLGEALMYFSNSVPCYVASLRHGPGSRICSGCPVTWGTELLCVDTFCTHRASPLIDWFRLKYEPIDYALTVKLSAVAWVISELVWSDTSKTINLTKGE